ncbi:SGNH/GDSL hydrolase family protein [Clostridium sp. HBUAS56017]|uniref:SGNH/GDSL hydrolase family protein n=1 Tax=Clostridium sp. HBUAS56017 TaxID=2571128 RepID=UPI001178890E|nr:SGNH/GDSL hydrolase family protein [Clostridium sp. HBUAS56017]
MNKLNREKFDASKVDVNMKISDYVKEDLNWYSPFNKPFRILGFQWINEEHIYRRLPTTPKYKISEGVDAGANCTAGGQIRFKTDSTSISIKVKLSGAANMYHMAATGQCGFDCYIGYGEMPIFCSSTKYDHTKDEYQYEFYNNPEDKRIKDIILNFPLYQGVREVLVGLDSEAYLYNPKELNNENKIVFYGTSITQGGCASRPGMCYTNILSRKLNMECINLGFSGNGKGEVEIAEIINTINNVSCIVIDYEANCITTELYRATLPKFIEKLREKDKDVKILLLPMVYSSKDLFYKQNKINKEERLIFMKEVYEDFRNKGDKNIHFYDIRKAIGEDFYEATVDGVHPTDYGFYIMAKVLYKEIIKII